ncbi:MAG TPA: FecR domain-containing protein [Chitinophaga sp.]|uniref:FecR domain-containing protein n=1 Tax=Chitinophaga sp. TaxID=1869181 RepID=UPI002CF84F83|nr:FecR domain-containing protein [Chitinophaga sp.]HVI46682.1 FecR domain-containing protein [Chitinophaga sp.]
MDRYHNYTLDDFLQDDAFIQGVLLSDAEQERQLNQWLQHHPEKRMLVQQARELILRFRFAEEDVPPDFDIRLKQRIDTTIASDGEFTSVRQLQRRPVWIRVAAIAASLIAGTALLWNWLSDTRTIITTPYGETRSVWLPDSTEVILNAHSTLRYNKEWSARHREVWIDGEAFLKVKPVNTSGQGPAGFIVHTNGMEVSVLGTEFNVRSTDNTTVMLQSGKVRVTVPGVHDPFVLQPNDYLHYNKQTKNWTRKQVDPQLHTAWMRHQFIFEHQSLEEVCMYLQNYYGTPFVIRNSNMKKIQISGTIELQEEEDVMSTLSGILSTDVKKENNQIIIQKK